MANNPKKSKAFIITFIAVLVLLIAAYFIFRNGDTLFGTKNSTTVSKTFAPLLGSSKPTDVNVANNGGTQSTSGSQSGNGSSTTNTSSTNTSGSLGTTGQINGGAGLGSENFGSTGNLGATDGTGTGAGFGANTPQFKPLPTPTNALTNISPTPSTTTPTSTPTVTPTPDPNICPDDPLVFTDSEKTELDALLRQYYLIAPSLKTQDDIAAAENDITTNQALIDQASTLLSQCQVQKLDPRYTGPQAIKNNPYYSDPINAGTSYLPDFSAFEQLFNIW